MGFTKKIMSDWGDKTVSSVLRYRLEKAGHNWLGRKSVKVKQMLDRGELTVEEAATQLAHLSSVKDSQISEAMNRHRNGGPAQGGPPKLDGIGD